MSKSRLYLVLAIVAVGTFTAAILLPASDAVSAVVATPGAAALIGALWQVFRDNAAFEKDQHLQRAEQMFILGANSHMAKVAFDKHVEFAEGYMREVQATMDTLLTNGPTEDALLHANNFRKLAQEYAAWIPPDVYRPLEGFENAARKLGALAHYEEVTSRQRDERHHEAIGKVEKEFYELLNFEKDLEGGKKIDRIDKAMDDLRSILSINELIAIRQHIIDESMKFIKVDADSRQASLRIEHSPLR